MAQKNVLCVCMCIDVHAYMHAQKNINSTACMCVHMEKMLIKYYVFQVKQ